MYKFPFLFTKKQFLHIFFIEDLTFIFFSMYIFLINLFLLDCFYQLAFFIPANDPLLASSLIICLESPKNL